MSSDSQSSQRNSQDNAVLDPNAKVYDVVQSKDLIRDALADMATQGFDFRYKIRKFQDYEEQYEIVRYRARLRHECLRCKDNTNSIRQKQKRFTTSKGTIQFRFKIQKIKHFLQDNPSFKKKKVDSQDKWKEMKYPYVILWDFYIYHMKCKACTKRGRYSEEQIQMNPELVYAVPYIYDDVLKNAIPKFTFRIKSRLDPQNYKKQKKAPPVKHRKMLRNHLKSLCEACKKGICQRFSNDGDYQNKSFLNNSNISESSNSSSNSRSSSSSSQSSSSQSRPSSASSSSSSSSRPPSSHSSSSSRSNKSNQSQRSSQSHLSQQSREGQGQGAQNDRNFSNSNNSSHSNQNKKEKSEKGSKANNKKQEQPERRKFSQKSESSFEFKLKGEQLPLQRPKYEQKRQSDRMSEKSQKSQKSKKSQFSEKSESQKSMKSENTQKPTNDAKKTITKSEPQKNTPKSTASDKKYIEKVQTKQEQKKEKIYIQKSGKV